MIFFFFLIKLCRYLIGHVNFRIHEVKINKQQIGRKKYLLDTFMFVVIVVVHNPANSLRIWPPKETLQITESSWFQPQS